MEKIMYQDGQTFLWNGLPAIAIWNGEQKYGAIFTNYNGEFTVIRIPLEEINMEKHKLQAEKLGIFDCLKTDMDRLSDEFTVVLSLKQTEGSYGKIVGATVVNNELFKEVVQEVKAVAGVKPFWPLQ